MKNDLEVAIEAAIEAGKAIMEVYASNFDIEIKGDNSPLTTADKRANGIINEYLQTTSHPIISEENKQLEYSERRSWTSCWIVDPLDGTKEFIKRNGEFTVNIALAVHGSPQLGVIYVPAMDTLYFTAEDGGANKLEAASLESNVNSIIKKATAIEPMRNMESPIRVVGSRSHLNDDTKNFIENLDDDKEVEIVSRGSSLKFCLVAEGSAHLYPRFAPTMEWDTAAGQAICQAVGVSVIDNTTNKPLQYNKENLLNPYFLVSI